MNITCPPGSYDANVEPAKDDVLFEDSKHVLSVVENFLKSIYGELVTIEEDAAKVPKSRGAIANKSFDLLLARKPPSTDTVETPPASIVSPILSKSGLGLNADLTSPLLQQTPENAPQISSGSLVPVMSEPHPCEDDSIDNERPAKRQRTWRFNMYGGDEEIMDGPTKSNDQDQRPPSQDEPEALRDVGINNPWIIAKMNAAVRPKLLDTIKVIGEDDETRNNQLPTPARDQVSSERLATPFPRLKPSGDVRGRQALPTPERSHLSSSPLKGLLSSSLQRNFDPAARLRDSSETLDDEVDTPPHTRLQDPSHSLDSLDDGSPLDASRREPLRAPVNDFISARDLPLGTPLHEIPTIPARPPRRREPRKQAQHQSTINKPFVSPVHDPDQVWFQTDAPVRRPKPSAKPRAGTIRGAISLSAPVRPDSEDEEPLESDTARARASTKDADIETALQYEHRKQAATKRRRSQLLLSSSGTLENPTPAEDDIERLPSSAKSPHRNRYNAARAALKRPTPQPFASTINITANAPVSEAPLKSSVIPDGDPRAYLMRVRRRSAHYQAASKENGANGMKIKRTKTMLLPLESTPIESRTQNLSLALGHGTEGVVKEAKKARDVELYVSGGLAWGAFDGVEEEEIGLLEGGLRGLLKDGGWRMDGEDGDVGVDLRTAFEAYGTAIGMEV